MKKTFKRITCLIGGMLVVALLGLGILTAHDVWRFSCLQKKAISLKAGDSQCKVKMIMGEPDASWGRQKVFLSNMKMTPGFAYGRMTNWKSPFLSQFPYFFPFRIRLFGPDNDDIVVEFNDDSVVTGIRLPEKKEHR